MKKPETERDKLRKRVHDKGMNFALSHVMMAQCLILPFLLGFGSNSPHKSFFERLIDTIVCVFIFFGIFYGFRAYARDAYREVGQKLIPDATHEDITALLAMFQVLKGDPQLQAREKLLILLPELTEENASALDNEGKLRLQQVILKQDRELVLLSLRALEYVGTAKSLPSVRALTEGKHLGGTVLEVRETAKVCLTKIEERLERTARGGDLLRASVASIEPQMLLRSTVSPQQEEPSLLLRSGEKPGE